MNLSDVDEFSNAKAIDHVIIRDKKTQRIIVNQRETARNVADDDKFRKGLHVR